MRIGVTGNFASGKGTVCEMFRVLGAEVLDTDVIARAIVEPGSAVLEEITSAFGRSFIKSDGTLDRRALGAYVFDDDSRVKTLNSITHPAILKLTLEYSSSPDTIYMINAPVLFESGFDRYMDRVIVVSADFSQSINRGIIRDGISADEIKKRLSHQISLNEKIKLADYVIDNSKDIEFTQKQVCEIWNNLISRKAVR